MSAEQTQQTTHAPMQEDETQQPAAPTVPTVPAATAPPTQLDIVLAQLAATQALISNALTAIANREGPARNPVTKPEPFDGTRAQARQFLNQFTNWARSEGRPMNVVNRETGGKEADSTEWIQAVLSLLRGKAGTWASSVLQAIERNTTDPTVPYPYGGTWAGFLQAYHQRFLPGNEAGAARMELNTIVQGKGTVADYAGRFREVSDRTNLDDVALIDKFENGMTTQSKEWMGQSLIALDISLHPTTLAAYAQRAAKADYTMRRIRGDPRVSAQRTVADPNAMEIDATRTGPFRSAPRAAQPAQTQGNGRTVDDHQRLMHGRCYGCGSRDHLKRDGNHGTTRCQYCERFGHIQTVCLDRFLGRERGRGNRQPRQRVAATAEAPFSLFNDDTPAQISATIPAVAVAPAPAPAPAVPTGLDALVNAMNAQTSVLAAFTAARQDFQ